ncbi:DUF4150 domain-containing protein [Citrobacter rodentium]|jgi:hypothetical protein|uniref:Uncharacterized protein n=2 Tax=Citrobacter rodentium TaxID=67825 RepID=D2TPK9_CITRI|nr:DUF4150 domain-containing protein [Citrobacter rodentium]KIQ50132.1 type IV secretion protein Rhs [Citrobacter rodentium]QBY28606.1 DUF4150 domain-containing protein [Citrobacter rodentium]UHO29525.1 DUF4150 domain-containing protein [Citrobacter rodentium NBRC 105723 = DSM 16636]CBG88826.1 conserved hypothetical protein [Citrobacter rodentium ICC168]HAT8011933.1 type IV secretion protein Rhs [Citrobacter rodentium NBRC 105723 = DSM 16636]
MADDYLARKQSGWLVISTLPDVCKTPLGPVFVPVPYPVVAFLQESEKEISSVRANGHPVVVYNQSLVPTTEGDQPGTGTGLKSGTVGGKCYPKAHSKSVRAGKHPVLRHGDDFWMNGR